MNNNWKEELKTVINSAIMSQDKNSQRNYMYDALNLVDNLLELQQQNLYVHTGSFNKLLEKFGYYILFNPTGAFDNLSSLQVRLVKEFLEKELNK